MVAVFSYALNLSLNSKVDCQPSKDKYTVSRIDGHAWMSQSLNKTKLPRDRINGLYPDSAHSEFLETVRRKIK